jgi:hypothetical protein
MAGNPDADVSAALLTLARRYTELLVDSLGERLVSVVLFGSVARADAGPGSDIDLQIVARDLPRGQFARKALLAEADQAFEALLSEAEDKDTARLARIVRTPEEAERVVPLYLDMTEDAVLLHDQAGFFGGILERLRASLRRLGARRVRQGTTWYWDLNPDGRPAAEIVL